MPAFLLSLLPGKKKLLIGIAVFAVIFAAGAFYRHWHGEIYQKGFNAATREYEAEKMRLERRARKNILEVERYYEEKRRAIEAAGSDDPVGPGITYVLDGLHEAAAGRGE